MSTAKRKKFLSLTGAQGSKVIEREDTKPVKTEPNVYFLAQATELGFSIAVPISLGALIGVWVDNKLGPHPKFTLSFLVAGIFLAFLSLFNVVKEFSKKRK